MMAADGPRANLLTPEYWGGIDIQDQSVFRGAESIARRIPNTSEFQRAAIYLGTVIGQIASGNCTEIRYDGDTFDTDLGAGSIVVVDNENITRTNVVDYSTTSFFGSDLTSADFTRPYVHYWMQHQSDDKPIGLIKELFADESVLYVRSLNWGVLMNSGRGRGKHIQIFGFNEVRFTDEGYLAIGRIPELSLPLPVNIGESTKYHERGPKSKTMDMINRVLSIDVVYPVNARRENAPDKQRRRSIVPFPSWAMPRLLPGQT